MNFNFTGVEVATENGGGSGNFVTQGFQKLTILSVTDAKANSGSQGVEVEFSSEKGGSFKQKYWLVNPSGAVSGAAPSFQYLVEKFTGAALEGNMSLEALSAKLVGKSHDVTVGGRKYTTEKDGKKYNNMGAWLPFAGWSGESEPRIDPSSKWDESESANSAGAAEEDDNLPF